MAKEEMDFTAITQLTSSAGASADTEITLLKVKAEEYMATQHAGYPKAMLNNIFDLVFELVGHRANGRISLANDAFQGIEDELLQLRQLSSEGEGGKSAMYDSMHSIIDAAMVVALEDTKQLEKPNTLPNIKKAALEAEGIRVKW